MPFGTTETLMNTDFVTTEGPRDQLVQTEVFDKVGVLAEIRFATEHVNDDLAHTGDNLVVRPARHGGLGEIRFVGHHPAGQVADGLEVRGKLLGKRLGQPRRHAGGQNGDADKNPNGDRFQAVARSEGCEQASQQRANEQRNIQPTCPDQFRRFLDSQFSGQILHQRPPLLAGYQGGKDGGGCNLRTFPSAVAKQRFTQNVEGALSQTNRSRRTRDLALDKVNQQARSEQFLCFRSFDTNIEGFFNRHHHFNAVQSHGAILGKLRALLNS